jgi:tRNA threonylcarbamoyl adenosine modification protein YeaZ
VNLTLAIETSSINYGVAVSTRERLITHRTVRRDSSGFVSIGVLAESVLAEAGGAFADIERLAVNVGPGNLGSVRAGVSYANGLAFSLEKPVFGADSLTLTATEVVEGARPVLVLRNAGGGNVYAGLFRDGATVLMRHGPMRSVVPAIAGRLPEVSLAGAFRHEATGLLPDTAVKDTGVEFPNVLTLHRLVAAQPDETRFAPFASPLTDTSEVFGG